MNSFKAFIKSKPLLINCVYNLKRLFNILRWYINKPNLPKNLSKVFLHLGCGDINHFGMINIDRRPANHIHFLHGVETLPMFKDESVDLIYVSHCLEHISYRDLSKVLKEWNRVLKKNGILRISVPDFDVILNIYEDVNHDLTKIFPPLYGGQDYKYNFHYSIFNKKHLTQILKDSNFKDVRSWEQGEDEFACFNDWSSRLFVVENKNYKISLNIQAQKNE